MLWFPTGYDAVVACHEASRASADADVTIRGPGSNATVTTGTAALEAVETELAEGAAPGAETLHLLAAPTLRSRGRYLVGGSRPEEVRVRYVYGTAVTLERPLRYAHVAGDAFESTRFEFSLLEAFTGVVGENYRAVFESSVGVREIRFAITPRPFSNPLTPELLHSAYDPTLPDKHPRIDWDEVCDRAFQAVVARIGARGTPAWDYLDAEQLLDATAFQARRDCAISWGPEWQDLRDALADRVDEEIDLYCAVVAADVDRSGTVSPDEKRGRTGAGRFSRKVAE